MGTSFALCTLKYMLHPILKTGEFRVKKNLVSWEFFKMEIKIKPAYVGSYTEFALYIYINSTMIFGKYNSAVLYKHKSTVL